MRIKLGVVLLGAAVALGINAGTAPAIWAGNTPGVTITKVVSGSNATNAGGSVTYTITVTNLGGAQVFLDCVTDTFPAGFTWDMNTGGGFDPGPYGNNDPSCTNGWFFDGATINPGDSLSWSFLVDVNAEENPGCYYNNAAAFWDQSSVSTGDTAPVAVGAIEGPCGQQTPQATAPAVVRSATPTRTATPQATDTELAAPATATVPPAPPASPTKVGGGVGAGITGPNTGSGAAAPSGAPVRALLLTLAAVLAVAGGGIAATGRVRR